MSTLPPKGCLFLPGTLLAAFAGNKYTSEPGPKFNLSPFHGELLKGGCVPLSVPEQKMARRAASPK